MTKSLDIDAVRSFVYVTDFSSFTRAAEALNMAQAAVSLKIKRLEDRLGYRLLDRTPRKVALSKRGHEFIDRARELLLAHDRAISTKDAVTIQRLSFGISDHVADPDLPTILRKLDAYDPTMQISVKIAASRVLVEEFDRGRFDAIVVRHEDHTTSGKLLFEDKVGWYASPNYIRQAGTPLRLATLAESCGMRRIATAALDEANIEWRETFIGGGILAVGAAANAGLGVVALASRIAPAGLVDVGHRFGLPSLPSSQVISKTRDNDARSQAAIRTFLASFKHTKIKA